MRLRLSFDHREARILDFKYPTRIHNFDRYATALSLRIMSILGPSRIIVII